jgi:L-2-hydroxyglutarate oxidase
MLDGTVEAGPNAVLAAHRSSYSRFAFSPSDTFSYLSFAGFWKMALTHGRAGWSELWRSLSKRAFVRALARLIPEISPEEISRGGCGIRAQALSPAGALLDDFEFREAEQMIHVLNAPSPAATASIAIGQQIARIAARRFPG